MYILAIETTGPFGSVALATEETFLGKEVSTDTMNHLKDLIPMMERLLRRAGVAKSALSYVAASVGPGSFTGIRIGVSTARALGQALDIPVISVPTLETFAYKRAAGERMEQKAETGERPVICGILNARRGQVYGIIEEFLPGGPYMLTDVLEIIKGKVKETGRKILFFGDGIDAYEEQIIEVLRQASMEPGREFFFAEKEDRYQDAEAVVRLGLKKVKEGRLLAYDQLHPQYMRKAEAEQKLEAGQLPICKLPPQQ